jgi:hypothetical protein
MVKEIAGLLNGISEGGASGYSDSDADFQENFYSEAYPSGSGSIL